MNYHFLSIGGKDGLLERLSKISDPRKKRGVRHNIPSVLGISICAVLSGSESYLAISEWAADLNQEQLKLFRCWNKCVNNKTVYFPPSEPTIRRILQSVDGDEIDMIVGNWLYDEFSQNLNNGSEDIVGIAIDGKTLRGSGTQEKKQVHLVSALVHDEKIVIGQYQVDEKSNEITAFKPLFNHLDITGKVVTADAMHTQRGHAIFIKEVKEADFIFQVKANQKTLLDDIKAIDTDDYSVEYTVSEKGHGRIETRKIQTSTVINDYSDFPYLEQAIKIVRITMDLNGENRTEEISYYVTSLTPERADGIKLLKLTRGHWHIENCLHWVRDVTFDEDRSQVRTDNGPRVMASLRNLVISLFHLNGIHKIASTLRKFGRKMYRSIKMVGLI